MKLDPLARFLGVPADADPFALLGLDPATFEVGQIETALRNRLSKVDRHPDSGSAGAQQVRDALRQAAMQLANPAVRSRIVSKLAPSAPARATTPPARPSQARTQPAGRRTGGGRPRAPHGLASLGERRLEALRQVRRGVRPSVELTAFDRHVLAVLVSCGGWNRESRSKLVALASAYNVTVQGLFKVVTGLSEYARQGGDRFGVGEITAGQSRFKVQAQEQAGPSAEWVQRMAPEVSRDQRIFALRMAAILSVLVIIAAGALWAAILRPKAKATIERVEPQLNTPQLNRVLTQDAPPGDDVDGADESAIVLATWSGPPTLMGNARPAEAVAALDRMITIEADLDEVHRRMVVADAPHERIYRDWNVFMQDVGACWVLLDDERRRVVDRGVFDILSAAPNDPNAADRFLQSLTPPARLDEPISIWRGAWMAGMLAKIADNPLISRAAGNHARLLLTETLQVSHASMPKTFDAAASAWLEHMIDPLVRLTGFEPDIDDYWELWLAAQQEIGGDERRHEACMTAIEAMLRTGAYMKQEPHVNVLGRLLTEVDLNTSPVVKKRFKSWFNDPEIEVVDLWVVTSLMAQFSDATWFTIDLVLPQDADYAARNLLAAEVDRRWPESAIDAAREAPAGRAIEVDAATAVRWFELLDTFERQSMHTADAALMRQLIVAVWFNEAAARMAKLDSTGARAVMDRIEAELAEVEVKDTGGFGSRARVKPLSSQPRLRVIGHASGPDGEWARAFDRANARDKLDLLQSLRESSTGDLGPINARMFVLAVYRGPSREVRTAAQSVAREFANGPNVLLALINRFPNRPGGENIAGMVATMTGRRLPETDSPAWAAESRLALIEHYLELKDQESQVVAALADQLADAYLNVLEAMTGGAVAPSASEGGPNAAAQRLADAWRTRAGEVVVARPFPDSLAALGQHTNSRLRLADAAPQRLVAWRLAALELATYVAVAEQPRLRDDAARTLSASAAARRNVGHVLQQALEVERAISRIWSLRLTFEAREEFSQQEVRP